MKNKEQYPPEWEDIKLFIRERDNYTCQHCGIKHKELKTSQTGKVYTAYLCVAHLDHDKENWGVKMDRLLLLCQACHLKNDRDSNLTKAKESQANVVVKTKKQAIIDKLRADIAEYKVQLREIKKNKYIPSQSLLVSKGDTVADLKLRLSKLGLGQRDDIMKSLMEVVETLQSK